MAFLSPTRAQRSCSNGHDQELPEGLGYLRDSSLGTAEDMVAVCSLSLEENTVACQPSPDRSTKQGFAGGSVGERRWRRNLFRIPTFPFFLFFPPLKGFEEIIA